MENKQELKGAVEDILSKALQLVGADIRIVLRTELDEDNNIRLVFVESVSPVDWQFKHDPFFLMPTKPLTYTG